MENRELSKGILSQLLASLYTLKDCIERCPEEEWDESHGDYPFSRVAFHALFDCDLNSSDSEGELKDQAFHAARRAEFGAYEELEGRIAERQYPKAFLKAYLGHCIGKLRSKLGAETDGQLLIPNSDFYRSMTKAERYINCTRHTQHHAAQLGLRLQFVTGKEMDWVGRHDDAR